MTITRRLVIHGQVQGVGYRYSMSAAAERIGITGWVRNRRDGTVEAIVQGTPLAVEQIMKWAERGPAGASVSHVTSFEDAEEKTYTNFTQQPTS
jgi:acylphosphatase